MTAKAMAAATILVGVSTAFAQTSVQSPSAISDETPITLALWVSSLCAVATGVWFISKRNNEIDMRMREGDERMKRMEANVSSTHRMVKQLNCIRGLPCVEDEYVSPDIPSKG